MHANQIKSKSKSASSASQLLVDGMSALSGLPTRRPSPGAAVPIRTTPHGTTATHSPARRVLVLRINRSHVKMNRAGYASNGKARPAATQPKRDAKPGGDDPGKSTASRPHRVLAGGIRERRAMLLLPPPLLMAGYVIVESIDLMAATLLDRHDRLCAPGARFLKIVFLKKKNK